MHKLINPKSLVQRIALAASCLTLLHSAAQAQDADYTRAGRWEFGIIGQYQFGDDVIKSALGTGGVVGYNFNEHWNLNLEIYCGIQLETEVDDIDGVGSIYTGLLSLDYNFRPGPFSPYATAGVGFFNYDSKESFDDDEDDSAFNIAESGMSYGGGLGVRWEVTTHFIIKAAYRGFGSSADGAEFLHGPEVILGWKF